MARKRKGEYVGLYGNVHLMKGWCENCRDFSFIIDGVLECCEVNITADPKRYKRETHPEQRRKPLSKKRKQDQIDVQENKCFYCNRSFGTTVFRKNKPVRLRVHYDHLVPYAYTQDNTKENFVAACHVCNVIKSSLVFQTVEEAQIYILDKWNSKGYSDSITGFE